jgi:beta-phosphoglucomutase
MIKGIIFDLDGVLVSTDEYHYHSWKRLCDEEGFTFFDHEFNHKFRGVARMQCVEILLNTAGKQCTLEQKQEIANRKNRYFVESLESVTPQSLLPGSKEMLTALRKKGIKIAIASNSRNAKAIIEKTEIGDFLDVVVDGYDIENSKPDPEVFLLAAERLELHPYECIVVEDAVAGIIAAERAGMRTLGIGTRAMLPNAKTLVKDLSKISADELLRL